MRHLWKISLMLTIALAAIVVSRQDADADPSYGDDFGFPGLGPGTIYEPAPFLAPVIGPTVPPPMLSIGDLLCLVGPYVCGTADMDDISYGNDLGFAAPVRIEFSTGPGAFGPTTGHPGAIPPPLPLIDVRAEAAFFAPAPLGDGSPNSDIYMSWPMPFFGPPPPCFIGQNMQVLDEDGALVAPFAPRLGLNMPAAVSNLDQYERSGGAFVGMPAPLPLAPVFFTISGATPWPGPAIFNPFGPPIVPGPGDVIAFDPAFGGIAPFPAFVAWAPAVTLGIIPGPADDIDALAVSYGGAPIALGFGAAGPPDTVWLSLAPGSASLGPTSGGAGVGVPSFCPAPGGTAADIWFVLAPFAPRAAYLDAEHLGLNTVRSGGGLDDNIDAMDFCTEGAANSDSGRLGTDGPDADLLPDDRTNPHEDTRIPGSLAAPLSDACDWDDDNDGLSDAREMMLGTSPVLTDTDGDVFTDWVENAQGSDPLVAASRTCTTSAAFCANADMDGVPDGIEAMVGSSTAMTDTDGDLMSDRIEIMHRSTSPTDANTDNTPNADGCSDRFEILGLDANGMVAFSDLLLFAGSYNSLGPGYGGPTATWDANKDYNGSGDVGFADLLLFAAAYNQGCGLTDLAP